MPASRGRQPLAGHKPRPRKPGSWYRGPSGGLCTYLASISRSTAIAGGTVA